MRNFIPTVIVVEELNNTNLFRYIHYKLYIYNLKKRI